jgi:hydrogenase nickel incorporation protein HypA/HybF
MHETGLVKSLLHEVDRIAMQYNETEVLLVRVRVGALCPFSEEHLREHFVHEAKGTVAEHAALAVEHGTDPADPLAQDVVLLSIEVEDQMPVDGGRPTTDDRRPTTDDRQNVKRKT